MVRIADELKNIDFHQRNRHALTFTPALYCFSAFLAVTVIGILMDNIHHKPLFLFLISLVMWVLCMLLIFLARQTRDLVMVTEFQNAILASAVQMDMRFCLIVEHTGTIAYMDRGFQGFFPLAAHTNVSNIRGVFSNIGATPEAEAIIHQAITTGNSERILCTLQNAQGESLPLMIMVDPLPRPKGFFLIRGRDYVTKRKILSPESEQK